jgi:hemerythrin-like domain-containing protein
MLEFLKPHSKDDAINLIKADHDKVQDLFDRFEVTEDRRAKKLIVEEAVMELKIHAALEEEIFYPAVREKFANTDVMNEADEEHHVAKVLIAELDEMTGAEEHFDAKFKVLAESVRHHIKEEEDVMLPGAREIGSIDFDELGRKMMERKEELKKNGIPTTAEEMMVAKAGGVPTPTVRILSS